MKTKLLSLLSFIALSASAQSVTSYYGDNNTGYTLFSAASPLDHSASGANQAWNFSGLTMIGNVTDVNGTPSVGETATYQNSTDTATSAGTENGNPTSSTIYSNNNAGAISVTGVSSDGLILNYSADNAAVGTYPLNYGYSNTDAIAGTFTYTTYSGTFTGTLTTSVDAYGSLTLDPGPDDVDVVRLRTQQAIALFYPPFGNVGTVTIDSYSYFESGSNSPIFRSATTTMVVPLLSINQTKTRTETMTSALGINDINKNLVQLLPNPVNDVLNVVSEGNEMVRSVRLFDVNGRLVAESSATSINVSQLQKGIYFAIVTTDTGASAKKIVKQ
jgi:type IX secretion system substrate protein